MRTAAWLLGILMFTGLDAAGGQGAPPPPPNSLGLPASFSGPPPPVPPATINRDSTGMATVRAVRLTTPLRIDGRLDEEIYVQVPAMSDFIQNDPEEGAPATEKSEFWVFFDADNVYVVAKLSESQPDRLIADEMRRDNHGIFQNDQIAFTLDTFYDRRNGVFFEVGAAGGRIDGQFTNERSPNMDWNPIWEVKTGRFEGGWTVEAAVPFKSLRYKTGTSQVWGFQARRLNKWKNERSFLTPIPASVGPGGHFRSSLAATLVGIEAPPGSKNLEIKPYVTSSVTTDTTVQPAVRNDPEGDFGVDLKYGLTQSLTADFTYNTDFAQVEADQQQVNLTRFSLFFPEKREFFLENAGTFGFGGASTRAGGSDTPLMFYSRRIGLSAGREIPLWGGGRLTGRAGPFTLGAINVQSKDEPASGFGATNFTVMRVRRDILGQSNVGAIFTQRSRAITGDGDNQAYGLDAQFSFRADLVANAYWARTTTTGVTDDDSSYRAQFDFTGDRYGLQVDHLMVGSRFDPQIGFVRRRDMRKNFVSGRFSPRTTNSKRVRRYLWTGQFNHIENGSGRLETRTAEGQFEVQFHNSDRFTFNYTSETEFLPAPFPIATNVTVPVGEYDFGSGELSYVFGRQRNVSSTVRAAYGTFFNGHKTTLTVTQGRVSFGPQISIEPSVSINKIDLVQGQFTTKVISTRTTYTMTPLMFATALVQYNSGNNTVAANVRFRWEYRPGSELFVVFNEQRDTLVPSFPSLRNRAFIVKINRVVRL